MTAILCAGTATLDIINQVDGYPAENDEIRAKAHFRRRGGNAANTAVVLAQLNHKVYWAGTLCREPDAQTVWDDFSANGINTDYCEILPQGKIPTSYITLNQHNGSRTIIHYRDLEELSYQAFTAIPMSLFGWLHFEGRNIDTLQRVLESINERPKNTSISLEIEKSRENIENLIPYADLVLYSKDYTLTRGYEQHSELVKAMSAQYPHKRFFCAWGEMGAAAAHNGEVFQQQAFIPDNVVDTLGAGDVFNAAVIHQQLLGKTLLQTLAFACRLAGNKCARHGINRLISR